MHRTCDLGKFILRRKEGRREGGKEGRKEKGRKWPIFAGTVTCQEN